MDDQKNNTVPKNRMPHPSGKTGLRLLRLLRNYKFRVILVCLCMAAGSFFAVRGTYYLMPAINDYIVPLAGKAFETGSVGTVLSSAGDPCAPESSVFLRIILRMACCWLISGLASLVQGRMMADISAKVLCDFRIALFKHMIRLPMSYFGNRAAGEVMNLFTGDIDALSNLFRRSVPYLVNGIVTCVTIIITMLFINVPLTLVVLVCISGMSLLLRWLAGRSYRHAVSQRESTAALNAAAGEAAESQELIRTLGIEGKMEDRFAERSSDLFRHASTAYFYGNSIFTVSNGINYIGYVIVLTAGAAMILKGWADIGMIGLFSQYYSKFYKPLSDMSKQFSNVLYALAGAERIFRVLDIDPEEDGGRILLADREDSSDGRIRKADAHTGLYAWNDGGKLIPFRGEISFDKVSFAYQEGRPILHGLSFTVEPGEKVAILGPTGSGKTTLISLLNCLYRSREGSIRIDGYPIGDIRLSALRRAVAAVPQETSLFTGSVRENLQAGRQDADDAELQDVLRRSGADFFVSRMAHGTDTFLDMGGKRLSQGERQLLSIARAEVSDAPILILDEATSSVDTRTERLIGQGFDSLMKGKTVLIIAHRLSTVRTADRIIILKDGMILEQGTHEELLKKDGFYGRLIRGNTELA